MGSSPLPTKKLDTLLPKPPQHNLVSHFILGEIIDHIDLIHPDFPEVDVPLLKKHLWDIRNTKVDPQVHLRGFLKVFQKTKVYTDAYKELDDGMKIQLETFIAGGGEQIVMAAGGKGNVFHLPPSPPVKHHFKEMVKKIEEEVEKVFHHEEHPNGANGTNGIAVRPIQKVGEKVHELFHHGDNSQAASAHAANGYAANGNAANGNAANEHAVDEYAVKEVTHGHVEKVKEDFEKLFLHEKPASATNGNAVNGHTANGLTNGHVKKLPSSTGYPRIFEDAAETMTMEVSY